MALGIGTGSQEEPIGPSLPRRFYASVTIDPDRAGRDVGRIAREVLQHLTILPRANMKLTLEIDADVPEGVADHVQRIVTENCQTLKFTAKDSSNPDERAAPRRWWWRKGPVTIPKPKSDL